MTTLLTGLGLTSWLGSGEKTQQEEFQLWSKGSPTGWYQHSKSSKFSFLRWWRRSLPKHIGLELLIYLVLYYAINVVYRAFLTDEQRQNFGVVVVFFKENVDPLSKDLAFLLGFFVKTVVSRWWSQYTRLPWPDSAALQLHGLVLFDEKEEEALQFVHTVMRYMVLSYVLSVRRISKVVQNIFPGNEELLKSRLLTEEELELMVSEGDLEKVWWIPISWAMTLTKVAKN